MNAEDPPRPVPSLAKLLRLAWPIVVSRSSQVVVGVTDALMVTKLGVAALAATTTGAFNVFAVLILPMGIAFIVSSFSSQLFGRGDGRGARRYAYYGLLLALGTQVLCVAGLGAIEPLLELLSYEPEVRALMLGYVWIRLLSGGAAIGLEALANYYGGLGNTRLPMLANVLAMVLNVFGNWVLIYGHLGAPAMGVKGAALASALATWIAFLGLLAVFVWEGRYATGQRQPLRAREFLRMLRFGIPSGLNWFFEFFAFNFFINVVVAGLGTTALAAFMAVMQINSVSFMPAFGLASAGAILVGQAIGAGAKDEVPRVVRLTFAAAGAWQGVVGIFYLLFPTFLFSPFADGEGGAELLRQGARMLMLSAAWQLFDAGASTLAEALRAAGDTAFTLWARLAVAWLVFVPGSYVTVRYLGGGDLGAVVWLVAYLGLLAGVLYLRFRSGVWRTLQLVEEPPA
ncbi:MAG: MATE family efflux transporter [Myxococcaceae bacterium]